MFSFKPGRDLLGKLSKTPNRYAIKFISDYYKKMSLSENFILGSTTEGYLFKLLKNVEVTKAGGIKRISGKFLKHGARILAKPISQLCNLSMTLGSFLDTYKTRKNHLTDTFLSFLNDNFFKKSFDNGLVTSMIMIDL